MAKAPVQFDGLKELRRDLRAMSAKLEGRELTIALRAGAQEVATAASPLAPRRSGRLAASYRAGAAGSNAYVRSRLPYAAVQEFGGVIRPKGAPITIRPQAAVTRALEAKTEAVVDRVANAVDLLALRHGWR